MARTVALAIALLCAANPAPAQQQNAAGTQNGAAILDAFLDDVMTLTADFEQELRAADDSLLETASGSLTLSRPNRFRWRYEEPFEQLIVADATNLWIYDVELDQVTVTALDDTVASSPAMLLSGSQAVRDGFEIVETFERDGLDWVSLKPTRQGTDFTSVLIGFSGSAPQRLELVDGLNQVTRIELSKVVVNPELDEDAFEFEPPAGVDVIGTPG